jgi:hypothetical protein
VAGAGVGLGVGSADAQTANGRLTRTAPIWAATAVNAFGIVTPVMLSALSAGTAAAQTVAAEPAANRDLGVIQR